MKLTKVIILVLSLSVIGFANAKDLKIGILDLMKVVEQSKSAQTMLKEIDKKFRPKEAEITAKNVTLKEKVTELQKNQAIMSEQNIEKLQKEITDLKRDLDRRAEDFQRDYQTSQGKVQKKIMSDVQAAVDKIGKQGKYDLILQKPLAVYMNNELDITDKVIKAVK